MIFAPDLSMEAPTSPSLQDILLRIQRHQDRMADIQLDYDGKLISERRALSMQYYRLLNRLRPAIVRLSDELLLEIFRRLHDMTNHTIREWDLQDHSEPFFLDLFRTVRLSHTRLPALA